MRTLTEPQAWREIAWRIEKLKPGQGFGLCWEVDSLKNEGRIGRRRKCTMKARLAAWFAPPRVEQFGCGFYWPQMYSGLPRVYDDRIIAAGLLAVLSA